MTATAGRGSRIFIDNLDYSGEGRSIDINLENNTYDATAFTSQWKSAVVGTMDAKVDYKGVWEKSATGLDQWLTSNFTVTGKGMTIVPGLPVAGGVAYNGKIISLSRPVAIPIDNVVALNANFAMDGSFGRGKLIEFEDTAVGGQTGTGVDLGTAISGYSAQSTDKWVTTFHIFEFNGSGTYTVTLQESSDDGSADTYAAVASGFLAISGSTAGLFIDLDGPRERYARVVTTVQSGNATCKFAVAVTPLHK